MAEYRVRNADFGAVKVTEEEYRQLVGTRQTAPYGLAVWAGKMDISEVPEELQGDVQTIVNNRIAWCGSYENQMVSAKELQEFVAELAENNFV